MSKKQQPKKRPPCDLCGGKGSIKDGPAASQAGHPVEETCPSCGGSGDG